MSLFTDWCPVADWLQGKPRNDVNKRINRDFRQEEGRVNNSLDNHELLVFEFLVL